MFFLAVAAVEISYLVCTLTYAKGKPKAVRHLTLEFGERFPRVGETRPHLLMVGGTPFVRFGLNLSHVG
jgi:hypothetical protein